MRDSTTVILAEMAGRLNEEFGTEISELTPYDWWKRTKSESIQVPLPAPIRFVGRSPMFLWRDIKRWYQVYAEEVLSAR